MTTEKLTDAEIAALEEFRCARRWSYRQLAADVTEICGVLMPESSLTRAMTVAGARLRKTTIYPLRTYLAGLSARAQQLEAAR